MSVTESDGFYTPTPADAPRGNRWPWLVVVAGAAVIVTGGIVFSSGPVDSRPHHNGSGSASVATP